MLERKPDILDVASDYQEGMIQAGIDRALTSAVAMKAVGACHNCGEKIDGLFCDADCRDDYEWRKKREQANGKRT